MDGGVAKAFIKQHKRVEGDHKVAMSRHGFMKLAEDARERATHDEHGGHVVTINHAHMPCSICGAGHDKHSRVCRECGLPVCGKHKRQIMDKLGPRSPLQHPPSTVLRASAPCATVASVWFSGSGRACSVDFFLVFGGADVIVTS